MDNEYYGEIQNEEFPEEEVIEDYEEDLLDNQIEQPKKVKQNNDDFKQNRRQSTPYVKQSEKLEDDEENFEEYVEEEEEGKVYDYEDESEMIQYKEQLSNNDDNEPYEDDYEDELDQENTDQTYVKSNDESQSPEKNTPQQLLLQPPKIKRPPLPQLPKKPTYKDKYADLLKKEDYQNWATKQLKMENHKLRQKLKEISLEVTKLVEENNQRLPTEPQKIINKEKKKQNIQKNSVIDQEIENDEKKLKQQQEEILKLEYRLSQLSNNEYIWSLDQKSKQHSEEIIILQNKIKQDQLKLKQKGKDLEKYEMQDGIDKLLKEYQNKSIELINLRNKKSSLIDQRKNQLDSIEMYKQELPKIEQRVAELENQAEILKIDVNAQHPFEKLRENYNQLLSQKLSLLKHQQIMDKKQQQLSQIDKETSRYKRDKDNIDKEINQVEISLIDQRRQKDLLKNQIPPELFKQIPASMTQENISNVMHSEQQKESQRKLYSAKPPTSGRLKLTLDQDQNQQQQQQQQQQLQQQQQQNNESKKQIDEEIKVEEEIIEEPSERNNQIITTSIIQTQATKPPLQNKLNSKPFQIGKKTDTTDQVNTPAQSQTNNDVSYQGNNSQISENQYAGPSRVMRMMRRSNQPSQQSEEQYQLSTQQPQYKNEVQPQNNDIQKKVEFQNPIEAEPDYKPTFQIRKNRFNNPDEEPQNQQSEFIITTKQEDQSQKKKIRILGVQTNEQSEDQQFKSGNNQLTIDNQERQQNQGDSYVSRRRVRGTDSVEPSKITIKEQEIISEKKVEPTYEFQPRQESGVSGKRNRGNNKLNIWDQQPAQKENIHEIQEIKEVGEVKEIREVKVQENREMTLEEILGGGGGIQDNQDNNNHPVQRRKFEVPKDDYPLSQPVKKSIVDQSAKQKKLVLQAENQDLLDFEF